MSQAQKIVEEINDKQVTVGQLATVLAMYPAHVTDPYLEALREALRMIEKAEDAEQETSM